MFWVVTVSLCDNCYQTPPLQLYAHSDYAILRLSYSKRLLMLIARGVRRGGVTVPLESSPIVLTTSRAEPIRRGAIKAM